MDKLGPSLNIAPYANASFPNLGATGMIRDTEFKEVLSLAHQRPPGKSPGPRARGFRVFSDITLNLHRLNNTGSKRDLVTRQKMSANNAGVAVDIVDVETGKSNTYTTKSKACIELGVSLRTLNR